VLYPGRIFDAVEKLVKYKPHIEFHMNNQSCEIKYFESVEELRKFIETELSNLKMLIV